MVKKTKTKTQTEYKIDVYDMNAKKVDTLELDKKIFDGSVNAALLHDAIVMYEARKRKGCASTKNRSEVSGGGKKPWRQKGTGRARFGSTRNPIWRHGGVAFGPKPRDFSYSMPQRTLSVALRSALNAKLRDKLLFALEDIKLDEPKTKKMRAVLDKFKVDARALVVADKLDENVKRASQNLKDVKLISPEMVCSDDILRYRYLLITKSALQKLTKRLVK